MGKRYNNLIESIIDWDNLIAAHHLSRKGKRDQKEVVQFEANLWEELGAIQMEMLWGTYQPGRYRRFIIYEPKRREVLAAPYRDRVVQQAICRVTGPLWDKAMIKHNYACRPGKGTHAGADQVQKWMLGLTATGPCWILKMDVSKYFPSISHELSKKVIRRKIQCEKTLRLLDILIDSTAAEGEVNPVGIPVGNLTSQWIANLVGNEIDQWAKREMRIKRYARYMDDMVCLVRTKDEALFLRLQFESKLRELGMKFSKTSVLPYERGCNFLGYRIWPHKRLLRRDSIRRMKRRLKRMEYLYKKGDIELPYIQQRVSSWVAHANHAKAESLKKKLLSSAVFIKETN